LPCREWPTASRTKPELLKAKGLPRKFLSSPIFLAEN